MFTHYEDMKAMQNVEFGVIWTIRSQPRSPAMSHLTERIPLPIRH